MIIIIIIIIIITMEFISRQYSVKVLRGSSVARYDPKTDFHGHGDGPWGFDDHTFSG